jgi:hypothetical protein
MIHDNYDILRGKLFFIFSILYIIISCVLAFSLPFALYHFEHNIDIFTILLSIISVIIAVLSVVKLRSGLLHGVVVLLVLQALVLLPNGFARIMPNIHAFNLAHQMNDAIDDTQCNRDFVFVSGYNEPSVMFKIGTNTTFASTENLIEQFKTAPVCSLFFIGEKHDLFQKTFKDNEPVIILNGFKFNGGDNIMLYLYKK